MNKIPTWTTGLSMTMKNKICPNCLELPLPGRLRLLIPLFQFLHRPNGRWTTVNENQARNARLLFPWCLLLKDPCGNRQLGNLTINHLIHIPLDYLMVSASSLASTNFLRDYQILPIPFDPFAFVSNCLEDFRAHQRNVPANNITSDGVFVVPALPPRATPTLTTSNPVPLPQPATGGTISKKGHNDVEVPLSRCTHSCAHQQN
jgi:hypothetical protein